MKRTNKYKRRRKIRKLEAKLTNQINELHNKTILYITNKYKLIFLPIFESQGIVKKSNNRRLNREILRLKHYDFQQKLINKCKLIKGCSVKIVSQQKRVQDVEY